MSGKEKIEAVEKGTHVAVKKIYLYLGVLFTAGTIMLSIYASIQGQAVRDFQIDQHLVDKNKHHTLDEIDEKFVSETELKIVITNQNNIVKQIEELKQLLKTK